MARYPKRQKVKRYRRSFYTREMRLKKGIGIAVLVVAVLAAAWVAAPHVLDWATHTWYTVVRDRDLSASSAVSESASSGAQSTAASEPAASSVPEKEPEPEVKGTDIVTGLWAEVDVTTLTDEAAIRSAARQLKAQGMTYAILTLKDTAGQVYYASQTAVGAANAAPTQVELTSVASIFKEEGLVPVAALTAFRDPAGARADHALAIRYRGQEYLWLDNKASAGGNPWLNPYAAETVQYIGDLIAEVHAAGFDQVLLENVRFPSSTSAKQDYGTTNGVDRAGQLTADIAAWQARFGDTVTLWYGYSLAEVTGSSSQLGAPAAQLGVKNLLVKVPSSSTLDAAAREELTLSYQTVRTVRDPLGPTVSIYEDLRAHQDSHRRAELEARSCLSGPHKDDLAAWIDGQPARQFASQGQTRTAALSLKLAERELFEDDTGQWPVLLLDDVLSELDARRQDFVLDRITGGQVFITSCGTPAGEISRGKILHIHQGALVDSPN